MVLELGLEAFLQKKHLFVVGVGWRCSGVQPRLGLIALLGSAPWPRPERPWVLWACWHPSTWSLACAGSWGGRCHFFNSLVSAPKNGAVELIKTVHVPGISTLLNTLLNQSQCTLGLGFGEFLFVFAEISSLFLLFQNKFALGSRNVN